MRYQKADNSSINLKILTFNYQRNIKLLKIFTFNISTTLVLNSEIIHL